MGHRDAHAILAAPDAEEPTAPVARLHPGAPRSRHRGDASRSGRARAARVAAARWSSTAVSPASSVSISTMPAGIRMSSVTGPGWRALVPHGRRFPRRRGGRGSVLTSACPNGSWKNVMPIPLLVPAVAGQSITSAARRRRRHAAGQRPHEPGVERHALAGGRCLELALQALVEPERDPRGEPVLLVRTPAGSAGSAPT